VHEQVGQQSGVTGHEDLLSEGVERDQALVGILFEEAEEEVARGTFLDDEGTVGCAEGFLNDTKLLIERVSKCRLWFLGLDGTYTRTGKLAKRAEESGVEDGPKDKTKGIVAQKHNGDGEKMACFAPIIWE